VALVHRQALTALVIEGEENEGPLDRGSLAHSLDTPSDCIFLPPIR
jgi:hypothetical protein